MFRQAQKERHYKGVQLIDIRKVWAPNSYTNVYITEDEVVNSKLSPNRYFKHALCLGVLTNSNNS